LWQVLVPEDTSNVLGVGGFGRIYKAVFDDGVTTAVSAGSFHCR
jgi:hypothetical protein